VSHMVCFWRALVKQKIALLLPADLLAVLDPCRICLSRQHRGKVQQEAVQVHVQVGWCACPASGPSSTPQHSTCHALLSRPQGVTTLIYRCYHDKAKSPCLCSCQAW
jgi:hypothetical protein